MKNAKDGTKRPHGQLLTMAGSKWMTQDDGSLNFLSSSYYLKDTFLYKLH